MPRALSSSAAGRVLRHEPDVGGRGEVDDRVAALGRGEDGWRVEQVADDHLAVLAPVAGVERVEHARLVTLAQQSVDDVRADEARAAGNEDVQRIARVGGCAGRLGMYRLS